ncbi:MAG: polyprenyl synthetase family protein [Ignavibacteriaceae bacterium]|nr:polyprenyl synthetase family protein [Ignavibacteriaceae bacterium]
MNFKSLYNEQKEIVDKLLTDSLSNRKPSSLYEPASFILSNPGKRLRPVLVLFSAKAAGGSFDKAYNAALSVEMLHNFTLVHDDIMDNADKRRGRPTLHVKYDLSTAILAGDVLLAVAYEYLRRDLNGTAAAVVESFTKGLVEVCEGQSLDKEFEVRRTVSLSEYMMMIQKKTAALSKMCCEMGGLLAGGNDATVTALSNYGNDLGLAFQIQDDILDILADEETLGKPVGGDLIEGKKTFLFLKALEKSSGKVREKLEAVIDNKGINPNQVEEFKNIYFDLGVIDFAEKEVETLTQSAVNSLNTLKESTEKEFLKQLAFAMLKRNN